MTIHRPVFTDLSIKKVLPPDAYAQVAYTEEEMRNIWAEVVGFRSPEVVGKFPPRSSPASYTYQDKEKYPGPQRAAWSLTPMNVSGRDNHPLRAIFSEMEIIPTRQYYYSLPIGQATQKYAGATKLDENGYIIEDSYASGLPFPVHQGSSSSTMCTLDKRYLGSDNSTSFSGMKGL